jgi:hypothetical protein
LITWTRDTIRTPAALPLGLEHCTTTGTLELNAYAEFFGTSLRQVPAKMAAVMQIPPAQPVVYYPWRSFDPWGARYFLLPGTPDWTSGVRGIASFLDETELIYPSHEVRNSRHSSEGKEP